MMPCNYMRRHNMGQIKVATPIALVLILGGAALLRLVFFTGYHGYDDVYYIQRALELSGGTANPPMTHLAARIGLVGPTALFYRAFGVTPLTTSAFPLLCSLLGVFAAFTLGQRLYGTHSGLIAALLLALFPMDVIFASTLFPTEPMMLFGGVGLGCFILAERERRPVLYLASGLSLGLAALAHEAALMIVMVYPIYVFVVARPVRAQFIAAVGLALTLALDPLIHGAMGNPWARISLSSGTDVVQGTEAEVAYRGVNAWWLAEPAVRLFVERTFGLFSWLLTPIVILRLWRPADQTDRSLALTVAVGYLWLAYGTVSPTGYAPLARLPRYIAPLVLPAMWLLGHELAERVRPRARIVMLSALATSSVLCLMLDSGNALVPYEQLRAVLAHAQPKQVAIESALEFPLLFAERFHPRYRLAKLDENAAPPRDSVVVVTSDAARERVQALQGAELLARIAPPETFYVRLLRSSFAIAILRATRPPSRFETYARKTQPWALWAYRVP
jgi:4-amino-4-deoxy-L-arabinose transferase-like glycosyltransferase